VNPIYIYQVNPITSTGGEEAADWLRGLRWLATAAAAAQADMEREMLDFLLGVYKAAQVCHNGLTRPHRP